MKQQVELLGASNLTMSLPYVLDLLQSGTTRPLDVAAACGHGSSWGI